METDKNYRYVFEKYSGKKHECPNPECGCLEFVYYVDRLNDYRPISPIVGRCERINECGYHLTPAKFFNTYEVNENKASYSDINQMLMLKEQEIKSISFIDQKYLNKSMLKPACNFTAFLLDYLNGDMETFIKN
jgi:hypothetical protein